MMKENERRRIQTIIKEGEKIMRWTSSLANANSMSSFKISGETVILRMEKQEKIKKIIRKMPRSKKMGKNEKKLQLANHRGATCRGSVRFDHSSVHSAAKARAWRRPLMIMMHALPKRQTRGRINGNKSQRQHKERRNDK